MNPSRFVLGTIILVVALVATVGLSAAQESPTALGTAFTYQGQLKKDGNLISGDCSMNFRLYDDALAGNAIGNPIATIVTVKEGQFTVNLDFGAGAFNGNSRWLALEVKCAGDAAFVALPRQAIMAAPYSLYSAKVPWNGIADLPAGFADGVDDNTTYTSGYGLSLVTGAFSVMTSTVQARVTSTCEAGSAIRQVNADGSVICGSTGAGSLTGVYPGKGLTGGGETGAVTLTVAFSGTGTTDYVARADHKHAGSDITSTVGTATNADMVDGLHANSFAATTHNHDATYVNEGQANSITSTMLMAGAVTSTTLRDGTALAEIANNDGAGSGLDADLLDGLQSGNAASNIPVSNGTVNTNLNADDVDGMHSSAFQPRMAVATSNAGVNSVTYLTSACQNFTNNGYVTITTGGPGKVIVNAQARMKFYHVAGTPDTLVLAIGDTATDCGSDPNWMVWTIPGNYPASSETAQTFHVQRVFTVSGAGTYTYYLNGRMDSGYSANTDYFDYANINAVYYP